MTTADGALTRLWDPDAWTMQVEVVYERRAQHLYEFARRLRLDHEPADDAMQEAFARLLVHGRGRRIENPDAWLFRTVRNLAMDVHRGNRRLLVGGSRMTRSTASLEALLRVGPTDSAAYVAPAFAVVVARRPRQRPKAIPFLRSFGELAAAAAVVVVVGSVLLLARLGEDGAGVSNLTAAAAAMGVPAKAVVDAGGAFVAPRWNDGKLELLLARSTANGWTSAVIGQIEAERPAGGGASDVATATCDGIDLRHPVFVYGQIVGWDVVPRTLALHGLVPTGGGELIDGSFVFAAAAAKAGTPFWISSPRAAGAPTPGLRASGDIPTAHPGSVFEGTTASPVRCAAG